ncbi:hypothetical protein NFI96_033080 [Prochilodus magdalenae]|nr:hypothetical protein NFI96_033080 [Prochilodus magdalenae]
MSVCTLMESCADGETPSSQANTRVTDIFKPANIDEEVLKTLSREDFKDLFPGPENFLKRKKLWDMIGPKDGDPDQDRGSGNVSATCAVLTSQPQTSTPVHEITAKTVKLPDPPEYVVYTDSELDMVRSQYFDLLRNGKEKVCKMSKELSCRLIRNTITSMVAILRASPLGKEERYPSKHELRAMSQKIVDYYPMLRDTSDLPYAMDELRRILGGTNPKYIDETKKKWENFCANVQFYGVWKKVLKPPIPLNMHDGMLRFTPNLNPAKLLGFHHCHFDWSPITIYLTNFATGSGIPVKHYCMSFRHLQFFSFSFKLKASEDPSLYLEKRPLTSPVLLFDGKVCILAVGNVPVSTIPKEEFFDGMLMLMAYYYTMHLTYPKCVATLLSVIQTEVLCDAIHDRDATGAYKRAMAEWKSFIEK